MEDGGGDPVVTNISKGDSDDDDNSTDSNDDDGSPANGSSDKYVKGKVKEISELENKEEDDDVVEMLDDDDVEMLDESKFPCFRIILLTLIAHCTNKRITPCDTKSNTRLANDGEDLCKPPDKRSLFGSDNSKDALKVLRFMLVNTSLDEVNQIRSNLIQLLQPGKS